MWWHTWSAWVSAIRWLALEGMARGRNGQGKNASSPVLCPNSSMFPLKIVGLSCSRRGGSISPLTTPPPCHASTSKASLLVPNTHLLHLCHHILPLVNKQPLHLNWKIAFYVESPERNLKGIQISEWMNAFFIIVSHVSWHRQSTCDYRTPKYVPGWLKHCCMYICMYIFDPYVYFWFQENVCKTISNIEFQAIFWG